MVYISLGNEVNGGIICKTGLHYNHYWLNHSYHDFNDLLFLIGKTRLEWTRVIVLKA